MQALPTVSVIVPNFMHAAYLEARLASIASQSYQDFEVIMLDDASTDGSLAILESWATKDERFRLVPNEVNSGSTFKQWNKGAELARGKFLWIAESDDVAEPDLLKDLVEVMLDQPEVVIAYAQSLLIDDKGKALHSFDVHYQYLFKSNRWHQAHSSRGLDEIEQYFMLHNVVPNASGALLRAATYHSIGGADPTWKLNGDWMFYVRMLERGDIAYLPQTLNHFRLHDQTQRQKANVTGHVYQELLAIADYIAQTHQPPEAIKRKAYRNIATWWTHSLYRQSWAKSERKMNLQVNAKLFSRFLKIYPLVLFHIPYEGLVRLLVRALEITGLKQPLRHVLHQVFPNRFMPRAT
jgi:glycosyltransferase involved in cell wall biosynthesis